MEEHSLKVLEFDKVVKMLAERAACSLGRERAMELAPQSDLDWIGCMQAETTEAKGILQSHTSIPLGGITDVRPSIRKAEIGSMLSPQELIEIAQTLGAGRRLRSFLTKLKESFPRLAEVAGKIVSFEHIEKHVAQCIGAGSEVLDSASPALARIRSETKTKHARILQRLNTMIQSADYRNAVQEPVITQREDRYCIPIKVEYRSQVRGIVHDASASRATVFIEPEQIVELGNDLKQLESKEREEVEKVLIALTREVAAVASDALSTLEIIAHIDFVNAKAGLSLAMDATEPYLNKDGWLKLIQARHPLLTGDVVPIDVELGRKYRALLITGPNTGGKTVTLKTIGLITLMAQSGLHVPAAIGTEVAVFDQIFADIGDEQSIEQSLSTFSSHVGNIVRVIKTIQRNALVLFDELGAGTDPAEGAGLAKAILKSIIDKGARTVATTHYGELKEFAFATDCVQNASVEFDSVSLRPTYRLMMGVPGSSNAYAIAARLGMPDEIIKIAEQSLSARQDGTDIIIQKIEESQRIALDDRRAARKSADEAEALRRRYEEELRKLEAAKSRVEDEIRGRGRQLIDRYTKKLERALTELAMAPREDNHVVQLTREAKEVIEKVKKEIVAEPEPEEDIPVEGLVFRKGDTVRIAGFNQEGMLEDDIENGEATILIGSMRVTVPSSSIRPVRKKQEEKIASTVGASVKLTTVAANVSPELKLIAQRAEQAIFNLEKYIDDAQTAGLMQVRIIHGRGTGALKKAVWEYLKDHPGVDSFRLGERNEGGSGATVVKLK